MKKEFLFIPTIYGVATKCWNFLYRSWHTVTGLSELKTKFELKIILICKLWYEGCKQIYIFSMVDIQSYSIPYSIKLCQLVTSEIKIFKRNILFSDIWQLEWIALNHQTLDIGLLSSMPKIVWEKYHHHYSPHVEDAVICLQMLFNCNFLSCLC